MALTWEAARLIALLLNAITGLVRHMEAETTAGATTFDTLYSLRLAAVTLGQSAATPTSTRIAIEVFEAMRNLSRASDRLVERGIDQLTATQGDEIEAALFLLRRNRNDRESPLPAYRRIDERWRWSSTAAGARSMSQGPLLAGASANVK